MNVIEFKQVWKKFKKGEKLNSLRDAIPNFFRQAIPKEESLGEREFWAVKDVSFDINKGEVVGILGPNGAGKSTILKLLSRIMNPTKGSMAIRGRLSALIEVTAGFHPELTGRENAYLNGTILGMKRREIDAKFDEIVEFSGIGEFIDTPVKRYSSGMYSRLGFSVAAHMDPDILLVDEVLSVGDMAFQAKCAEKMRELFNSGTTIALVSHNLPMVQSLCKRVILLNKGEVLKDGPTNEVIPVYENIVFKAREEDLKKKISSALDHKVRINTDTPFKITDVALTDALGNKRESFRIEDAVSATINFTAEKSIDDSIFSLEINRGDGVTCCASTIKARELGMERIIGSGHIQADFGQLNLAPGLYLIKIGVWDKDFVHPYAIRSSDVLRVDAPLGQGATHAVFMPKVEWKV